MSININNIKNRLLVKYPPFGIIVANLKFIENEACKTAATDGECVYYNPKFVENLSKDEQTFLLAHEVCHVAFDHISKSEGKDKELWNIATDAVINQLLIRDKLKMIKGGVNISDADKCDAEEMYEKLLKKKSKNKGSKSSNKNGNEENSSNKGNHTHDLWEESLKKKKQNKSKKSKDNKENNNQKKLEEAIQEISKNGEKKIFDDIKNERTKKIKELKNELVEQSVGNFNNKNRSYMDIKLNDIGKSDPLVDFRRILETSIQRDVDYSYKDAIIEDGVASAGLIDIEIPEVEIVLDTSGSVNDCLLRNFLRQCKVVLKDAQIKVGCFDTQFYGFRTVRTEKDIDNFELRGRGNTNFNAAINAFSNSAQNKIIFTDGDASMPEKSCNSLWIVFGKKRINPKGGKVVYITPEQLKKLCSYVRETEDDAR